MLVKQYFSGVGVKRYENVSPWVLNRFVLAFLYMLKWELSPSRKGLYLCELGRSKGSAENIFLFLVRMHRNNASSQVPTALFLLFLRFSTLLQYH